MAAIDRVVHHSVILDMMEVESYRATEANHHRKLQQEATKIEAKIPAEIVAIVIFDRRQELYIHGRLPIM